MTKEVLKLALEALTYIYTETTADEDELIDKAIAAIKEALAKEKALQDLHDENERLGLYKDAYAEQEPLAWKDEHPLVVFAKECVLGAYKESELGDAARRAIEAAYNIKGKP